MKTATQTTLLKSLAVFGVVAGSLALMSSTGYAQDLQGTINTANTQIKSAPTIISAVCYIVGAALCAAGLLKLKAHSENPGQNPIGHGLGRLVIGGCLMALPVMAKFIQSSVGASGSAATYNGFSAL